MQEVQFKKAALVQDVQGMKHDEQENPPVFGFGKYISGHNPKLSTRQDSFRHWVQLFASDVPSLHRLHKLEQL